jgi:hypothetical protein
LQEARNRVANNDRKRRNHATPREGRDRLETVGVFMVRIGSKQFMGF